jgi:hypothetical protein
MSKLSREAPDASVVMTLPLNHISGAACAIAKSMPRAEGGAR